MVEPITESLTDKIVKSRRPLPLRLRTGSPVSTVISCSAVAKKQETERRAAVAAGSPDTDSAEITSTLRAE